MLLSANRLIAETNSAAWPQGYVVLEGSESDDGRYGIAVPESDDVEKEKSDAGGEEYSYVNYLADLRNHKLLGKIQGSDYFEHQNHAGLKTLWADDSSWCLIQYDERFGFYSMAILEPKDTKLIQTDIGERIKKALATVIKSKGEGDDESGGDAIPYYQLDDGKAIVRVVSTTDPKEMDTKHARYGFFQGTYDVHSKRWLSTGVRRLSYEDYENSDTALGDDIDQDLANLTSNTEEEKLQLLDEKMNRVYGFLRTVLPPARFATVKKEQVEWLKKRDAAVLPEEKSKMVAERIKTLQELLW
jgi:uncharacterized protein YecT (DUF1311 family)